MIHKLIEEVLVNLEYELKTQLVQVGRMHDKGKYICQQHNKAKIAAANMADNIQYPKLSVKSIYLTLRTYKWYQPYKSIQGDSFVVWSFQKQGT